MYIYGTILKLAILYFSSSSDYIYDLSGILMMVGTYHGRKSQQVGAARSPYIDASWQMYMVVEIEKHWMEINSRDN